MAFNSTFANDLLKLIFQATAIANIADNAASSPLTVLYISLHTSDPGASGTQATNETSYTGYARVALNRNSGAWSIAGNVVTPVATIAFGSCTVGTPTITHLGIGVDISGATKMLCRGAISPTIAVAPGVVPQLTTSTTITALTT